MSSNQTQAEREEMLDELRAELEPKVEETQNKLVETARLKVRTDGSEWGAGVLRDYAEDGHEGAQEAVDELGIEVAAAEQNPQANALDREDPYREKSLEERAQKHLAFGAGNENSPYDDPSPSTNAASGDVGPASSGSFADYNLAANADGARTVRLVDSPEQGETVHMYDSSEPGAVREASANGAEEVRIVSLNDDPEAAVDADPVYVAEQQSSAGSFMAHNERPETSLIAVNPEKLP